MKIARSMGCSGYLKAATLTIGLCLLSPHVFAAETSGDWRPVYDLIMRWINFILLAALLVKFAGPPLMKFLRGEREQYETEIRDLEKEKEKAVGKLAEAEQLMTESKKRFKTIEQKIIAQGKRRQQEIIGDAKKESVLMIENTRRKIHSRLDQAQKQVRMELVDAAMQLAMQRLAGELTPQDNQKITTRFINSIAT